MSLRALFLSLDTVLYCTLQSHFAGHDVSDSTPWSASGRCRTSPVLLIGPTALCVFRSGQQSPVPRSTGRRMTSKLKSPIFFANWDDLPAPMESFIINLLCKSAAQMRTQKPVWSQVLVIQLFFLFTHNNDAGLHWKLTTWTTGTAEE